MSTTPASTTQFEELAFQVWCMIEYKDPDRGAKLAKLHKTTPEFFQWVCDMPEEQLQEMRETWKTKQIGLG